MRRLEGPGVRRVYRVSELLAEVSEALSTGWRQISVAGEACEVRIYPSGHVYFSLKDDTGKLSAVMWRSDAARLRFRLEDGMEVVAFGTLSLYAARGQFQIQVQALEPVGVGALQIAFEQLKRKLAAEGLFDAARKKPLPFLPRRIGIVTSPQGAALRDILNVLARRHPNLAITIFPARVQGDVAPAEISEGIEALNRMPDLDVIIVARGGGSAEDLAAFNDERVARALAASRLPTISAVGHETDWTIADYVADLRAPTPSAAAEMVVGVKEEISRRVDHSRRSLLEIARRRLAELRHRLFVSRRADSLVEFPHLLVRRRDRFDAARESLRAAIAGRPEAYRRRLSLAGERLAGARRLVSLEARGRFLEAAGRLRALDPLSILRRGYAVVEAEGRGGPLTDSAGVSPGDALRIRLWRGAVLATAIAVDHSGGPGKDEEEAR